MKLTDSQQTMIDTFARVYYATTKQLSYYCRINLRNTYKAASWLEENGLVVSEPYMRPSILRLTWKGARVSGYPLPSGKRVPTISVQTHFCHRNNIEIELRKEYPDFNFLPRIALLKQGLRPSFGEHGGYTKDGSFFILVDDYLMPSNRITRCWERIHTPDNNYYKDHTGLKWSDIVNHYILFCSDQRQAEKHRRWIRKHNIPATVRVFDSLWSN